MFFFAGWQGTTIQNVGGTLNNTVPTAAMRAGDFSAITTPLRDPNGGFFPNNQIPLSRFDQSSLEVLKYLPVGPGNGAGGLVQVPRRIGQDDNQIIAKVDTQLNQNNQVSARYFFDHFTNDPTLSLTGGGVDGQAVNLLSYRGPTLGSRQRIQNIVGTWQRTMTSTLLNEFRVGFNKFASSRYPPEGVPSMQDMKVRLPIYPTDPSISQIEATGFFGIGDNLFATFPRSRGRGERSRQLGQGQAPGPVRRRDGVPGREDSQRVPARRTQHVHDQHVGGHRTRAVRLRARHPELVRPGHGRVQGLQGVLRLGVLPGRLQSLGPRSR